MKGEQARDHLSERIVDWPALDRKLVGKDIARVAWGSFRSSKALDLGNAEPGSLTDHQKYRRGNAVDLDALSEKGWWVGTRVGLQPVLTC